MRSELASLSEVFSPEVNSSISTWREIAIKSDTPIYLRGGAVRDSLVSAYHGNNLKIKDLDLVIPGNMFGVIEAAQELGARIEERNKRKRLPKYSIVLPDLNLPTDLSLLQASPYSYNEDLTETQILLENANRSNYDINTIAFGLHDGKLHDPLNGLESIKTKTMNLVSPQSLYSDPSTILDGIRIASKLKFTLSPNSRDTIRENSALILKLKDSFLRQKLEDALSHLSSEELVSELEDLCIIGARPEISQIISQLTKQNG